MRNNVKLLTERQLEKFNEKYRFALDEDDNIVVTLLNYGRVTKHDSKKGFSINSDIRKVTFSIEAIEFWKELKKESEYSLIDIQQAYNILTLSYEIPTIDSIKCLIETGRIKLLKEG